MPLNAEPSQPGIFFRKFQLLDAALVIQSQAAAPAALHPVPVLDQQHDAMPMSARYAMTIR
jgi:hypothetical protein